MDLFDTNSFFGSVSRRILFLYTLLILSYSTAFLLAETDGTINTQLQETPPDISDGIKNITENLTAGFGWRWRKEDGRRDCGQIFSPHQDVTANLLAVQLLYEGEARQAARQIPFELVFEKIDSLEVESSAWMIATFRGILPSSSSSPNARWLVFRFSELRFATDHSYRFVLRFPEQTGVNVVLAVNMTAQENKMGKGIMSPDGIHFSRAPLFNYILGLERSNTSSRASPRILTVDQRGGSPYQSIAQAILQAHPGDTIKLAPGSGPYRCLVDINVSGTQDNPIIFDGSNEIVTGFQPIQFEKKDGQWICDLSNFFSGLRNVQGCKKRDDMWSTETIPQGFPSVLIYKGERVYQNVETGQFEKYVSVSADMKVLTLLPNVDPEGWEISSREFVIKIWNVSHQVYRNLKVSGSLNDGFNLHGEGQDLVFENIESFQNFDEGFSAHDQISCEIKGGKFWQNDNGIGNVVSSRMVGIDLESFDNIGFGIWLNDCQAELENVKSYGNGVAQLSFSKRATVKCISVSAKEPVSGRKSRINYQESKDIMTSSAVITHATANVEGTVSIDK